MLDKSVVGIQKVDDFVSEPLVAGSENSHLIMFIDELQALSRERPNGKTSCDVLTGCGVLNRDLFISEEILISFVKFIDAASTMDQSFI